MAVFLLKLIPDGKKAPSAPDLSKDNAGCQETLKELVGLPAAGKLTPVIDKTYPLSETAEAMRHVEAGE